MTPAQIAAVEGTLAEIDLDRVTEDFYRRAFEADPALSAMFTTDPAVQRARFAAELAEIVRSVRSLDTFEANARALGQRHRTYGVCAADYRVMGQALMEALAAALADRWTSEIRDAWALAYNLTAETMMLGAMETSG